MRYDLGLRGHLPIPVPFGIRRLKRIQLRKQHSDDVQKYEEIYLQAKLTMRVNGLFARYYGSTESLNMINKQTVDSQNYTLYIY